jgi:hypothetical protein
VRQYKGESRDEWERVSCPGDVQPRERPEREYNPDDDPLWGLRGAEREAARERLFGPGQVPVELLATAATARTAPAVDPVLEAASLARGYAVLVYDAERLLDEILRSQVCRRKPWQ